MSYIYICSPAPFPLSLTFHQVGFLIEMGFPRNLVVRALRKAKGDAEEATDQLLTGMVGGSDDEIDEAPITNTSTSTSFATTEVEDEAQQEILDVQSSRSMIDNVVPKGHSRTSPNGSNASTDAVGVGEAEREPLAETLAKVRQGKAEEDGEAEEAEEGGKGPPTYGELVDVQTAEANDAAAKDAAQLSEGGREMETFSSSARPGVNNEASSGPLVPSAITVTEDDSVGTPSDSGSADLRTMSGADSSDHEDDDTPSAEVIEALTIPEGDALYQFPEHLHSKICHKLYTDRWFISVNKNEEPDVCMRAALKLVPMAHFPADDNCMIFLKTTLPECFDKLLDSINVLNNWNENTQQAIFQLCCTLIQLSSVLIKHADDDVLRYLMEKLQLAFDTNSRFHVKNRHRHPPHAAMKYGHYREVFKYNEPYRYGWIVDFINRYFLECLPAIQERFQPRDNGHELTGQTIAAVLKPLAKCGEFMTAQALLELEHVVNASFEFIEGLKLMDMTSKEYEAISEAMQTLKKLYDNETRPVVQERIDVFRLNVAEKLLTSKKFNVKMNGIKEVGKLCNEAKMRYGSAAAVSEPTEWLNADRMIKWLRERDVVQNVLRSSLHIKEYVNGLEDIVRFLVQHDALGNSELTAIWDAQVGQYIEIVRNVQGMLSRLARNFSPAHLAHLLSCFKRSWAEQSAGTAGGNALSDMLKFITNLAKDDTDGAMAREVLEMLWDLVGDETAPQTTVPLALKAIVEILALEKVAWMQRCVDEVSKGQNVVPALMLIGMLADSCSTYQAYYHGRPSERKEKLTELCTTREVALILATSCQERYTEARKLLADDAAMSEDAKTLKLATCCGKYSHTECLQQHLQLLKYLLKEHVIILDSDICVKMWELVETPILESDLTTLFQWFGGLVDGRDLKVDAAVQREFLCTMFPTMPPESLQEPAFFFFQGLFITVNEEEKKLQVHGRTAKALTLAVDDLDLLGLEYLWRVVLETSNQSVADKAISLLKSVFEARPPENPLLFIDECAKRLWSSETETPSGSVVNDSERATSASESPESEEVRLRTLERCLLLMEHHVQTSDLELVTSLRHRLALPHMRACRGESIKLSIDVQIGTASTTEFKLKAHTNQTIALVRAAIAEHKKVPEERIRLKLRGNLLWEKWQQPLHALGIGDGTKLQYIMQAPYTKTYAYHTPIDFKSYGTLDTEEQAESNVPEELLPGVLFVTRANYCAGLHRFAEHADSKISDRARALLQLLPTTPDVLQDFVHVFEEANMQHADDGGGVAGVAGADVATTSANTGGEAASASSTQYDGGNTRPSSLDSIFNLEHTSNVRLCYLLKALLNLLVPCTRSFSAKTRLLRRGFLQCGGLQFLCSLLQWTPNETHQDHETFLEGKMTTLQIIQEFVTVQDAAVEEEIAPVRSDSVEAFDFEAGLEESERAQNGDAGLICVEEPRISASCFNEDVEALGALVKTALGSMDLTSVVPGLYNLAWSGATGDIDRIVLDPDAIMSRHKTDRVDASELALEITQRALNLFTLLVRKAPTLDMDVISTPHFQTSVVDMLVACHDERVRVAFAKVFLNLALEGEKSSMSTTEACVKLLLETQLPLWHLEGVGKHRKSVSSYPAQCLEYFKLCAKLVPNVYKSSLSMMDKPLRGLVSAEVGWILELQPPEDEAQEDPILQRLITGHMIYLCALLTCCDKDVKIDLGRRIIQPLVNVHLFPASRQRLGATKSTAFVPICDSQETRMATLAMVIELCKGCPENSLALADLVSASHNSEEETRGQWDFKPMLEPRSGSGFVGLQNAGATCYMNSVVQQIYSNPETRSYILSLDDDDERHHAELEQERKQGQELEQIATTDGDDTAAANGNHDAASASTSALVRSSERSETQEGGAGSSENSLFYEMQRIFGSLSGSRMQFFKPEGLWSTYRDVSNQKVDVRKHEDAVEFFQNLTDKLDAHLAKAGRPKGLEKTYQGILADQKICRDPCDCYNESTQPFLNLEADVRNNDTLHESFDQMCQGDELSGENAYHCATHDMKVTALKRTCIKRLPKTMVVQLKRFEHDWENDRPVKVNDRFEFPMEIDMEPWTVAGLARRDAEASAGAADDGAGLDLPRPRAASSAAGEDEVVETTFRLAGIVVHSGTATAGHYYSFIRKRDSSGSPEGCLWHKFDDKEVTPWAQTDEDMESEFFGGEYTPKYGNIYAKQERSWSAYILFYERVQPNSVQDKPSVQGADFEPVPGSPAHAAGPAVGVGACTAGGGDAASITALMPKIDALLKRECGGVPAAIQEDVVQGNVDFMHRRDMFNPAYFSFVHDFLVSQTETANNATVISTARFVTNFVFNTYLHSQEALRSSCEICPALEIYFVKYPAACGWFLGELGGGTHWLRSLFVECKQQAIRKSAMGIVLKALSNVVESDQYPLAKIVELEEAAASQLFKLLDTGAAEFCTNVAELFTLYSRYIDLGDRQREHCLNEGLFERGVTFLVGAEVGAQLFETTVADDSSSNNSTGNDGKELEPSTTPSGSTPALPPKQKNWTAVQQRPLRWLRAALLKLVRASDLFSCCDSDWETCDNPFSLSSLPIRNVLKTVLVKRPHKITFINAVVMPSLSGTPVSLEETFSFCCCSAWGNTLFSNLILVSVVNQLGAAEVDSKPLFTLVCRLLSMQDGLQDMRIGSFLNDEQADDGMLPLVVKLKESGNARRAYLYLKNVVILSDQVPRLRDILARQLIWKDITYWLNRELDSAFIGYTSNTENDFYASDDVIRRTNSAEMTFDAALTILNGDGEGEDVAQQQQHHLDAASNVVDQEEGGDLALEA